MESKAIEGGANTHKPGVTRTKTEDNEIDFHDYKQVRDDQDGSCSSIGSSSLPNSLHNNSMQQQQLKKNRRFASHIDSNVRVRRCARMKDDIDTGEAKEQKPPILMAGLDIIVHVMTFLAPSDALDFLTMPLSRDWQQAYTRQEDLWRSLCVSEPFKAKVDIDDSDSDCSICSFMTSPKFGAQRMRYTSFVRCMRYLDKIKDAALCNNSSREKEVNLLQLGVLPNRSLSSFLANAPSCAAGWGKRQDEYSSSSEEEMDFATATSRKRKRKKRRSSQIKSRKKSQRSISHKLLGPAPSSSNKVNTVSMELPWSCAVYSIVNWMVAYSDVEGIQIMCLRAFSFLLEDEQQRTIAREAGLADVVIRRMITFPKSNELHAASFSVIALLARPLGGRDGMIIGVPLDSGSEIFRSWQKHVGAFVGVTQSGKERSIHVMLDSMRRFSDDHQLQTMSCWALVNLSLAPAQKEILVELGGMNVLANAMMRHSDNVEVQSRALMALINLVSPCREFRRVVNGQEDLSVWDNSTQEGTVHGMIDTLLPLVVVNMKRHCRNELVLTRACLVLRNLSLREEYHATMLKTRGCYDMLNWCVENCGHAPLVQQTALKTVSRLQMTYLEEASREAMHSREVERQIQE